jgi:hypothetical protein
VEEEVGRLDLGRQALLLLNPGIRGR